MGVKTAIDRARALTKFNSPEETTILLMKILFCTYKLVSFIYIIFVNYILFTSIIFIQI